MLQGLKLTKKRKQNKRKTKKKEKPLPNRDSKPNNTLHTQEHPPVKAGTTWLCLSSEPRFCMEHMSTVALLSTPHQTQPSPILSFPSHFFYLSHPHNFSQTHTIINLITFAISIGPSCARKSCIARSFGLHR